MRILVRKPNKVNNEQNTPAALWPLLRILECETWGDAWNTVGATPINSNGVGETKTGQLVYLEKST